MINEEYEKLNEYIKKRIKDDVKKLISISTLQETPNNAKKRQTTTK